MREKPEQSAFELQVERKGLIAGLIEDANEDLVQLVDACVDSRRRMIPNGLIKLQEFEHILGPRLNIFLVDSFDFFFQKFH